VHLQRQPRSGIRSPNCCRRVFYDNLSDLQYFSVRRQIEVASWMFGLGSLNVRSLSPLKLDDFIVEFPHRSLNVLAICEM